jgi:hypothetical protein
MGVFKRGRNYWYEFEFRGQRVRESAHTPDRELARSIERNRRRAMEESAGGIKRAKPILFRKAVWIKPDGGIEAAPTLLGRPLGPKKNLQLGPFSTFGNPSSVFDNALQEVSEVLLSLEKARPINPRLALSSPRQFSKCHGRDTGRKGKVSRVSDETRRTVLSRLS